MLTVLPFLLAIFSSDAHAKGKLDHTRSVTVAPIKLVHPCAHFEYEGMINQNTSFTAGASYGRLLSMEILWVNLVLSELDAPTVKVDNTGVNGAFNYYFVDFNRGWYASGAIEFDRNRFSLEGTDYATSYSTLTVGPTIGWKRVTQGGFTFSLDAGLGYAMDFGATAEADDMVIEAGGDGTQQSRMVFLGSLMMGYSF
jgi:hypothetical protein